jgi:hypothetical protein
VGRPRVYDEARVATAVRFPVSLRDELQAVANKRDVSVNFLVVRAVTDYLSRLPDPGGSQSGDEGAIDDRSEA